MTSALNEGTEISIDPLGEEPPAEADIPWGRAPSVLQVLPALVTGGAERGCVDISRAVVEGGGTS